VSLLTLINAALSELGLPVTTAVIGSSDATVAQMRYLADAEGQDLAARATWPDLTREHTFATVNGTTNYALPTQLGFVINDTFWNRSTTWQLHGPMTPEEWQLEVSGGLSSPAGQRFRIWQKRMYIRPTPTAAETIAFEYVGNFWCKPAEWVASTAYAAGATVSYLNNRYTTTLGGTSGSTAPTHTSGAASDGGVSWTYADNGYAAWVADSDTGILPERLMRLGLKWRFLKAKGMPSWEGLWKDYEREVTKEIGRQGAKPRIDMAGGRSGRYPAAVIPETGFGS